LEHREKIVYEDRQAGNVVYVRMCDNDVAYVAALRIIDAHSDTARVNGDAVIYQNVVNR
jgi:hypothetical protein